MQILFPGKRIKFTHFPSKAIARTGQGGIVENFIRGEKRLRRDCHSRRVADSKAEVFRSLVKRLDKLVISFAYFKRKRGSFSSVFIRRNMRYERFDSHCFSTRLSSFKIQ